MNIPGRRHWTEEVDLHRVSAVTSGPNTGAETRVAVDGNPYKASVQPVSDAEAIRHGLDTNVPVYWVRYSGPPLEVGDVVTWAGRDYRVASVSVGHYLDVEVMMRLAEGRS